MLCSGVFDLLHVAHKRHLEAALGFGDFLVVGVTMDETARTEKRLPIIPEKERLEMVMALKCVEYASLCRGSMDALARWTPDVFCKGFDYIEKKLLREEIEYCKNHGIEIVHTSENPQTTSQIIERIKCAS